MKVPAKKTKVSIKAPAVKTKPAPKPAVKAKVAVKPAAKKNVPGAPAKKSSGAASAPLPKNKAQPVTAKTAAKAAKPIPKPAVKAGTGKARPIPKEPPPSAAKAAPKVAVKAAKPEAKMANAPASSPVPPARPPEKSMLIPAPPALKPGRRSSARAHAQMPPPAPMVPTHAPDAAKASYSTMVERVIAPPPHVAAKKDPKLANNWKSKAAEDLTDDEVKAMPDSEYMNEKQMAFFRHKLSILKQEIHNSAGETTEHLREDTVVVPDPADRATIEEEHALELRTRDRERKLLKKIEQSIARIDSGDYGYCDETGEAIGVGRLIARPTANLSLEAQQRRELKQKMFGD